MRLIHGIGSKIRFYNEKWVGYLNKWGNYCELLTPRLIRTL
jgi:hypothetical protein